MVVLFSRILPNRIRLKRNGAASDGCKLTPGRIGKQPIFTNHGEYANNIDLHCRAFENNKDLQNGGGVIKQISFDYGGGNISVFSVGF